MEKLDEIAERAVEAGPAVGIVMTDPTRPGNPITYLNGGFSRLTGYARDEVLGRNCRFLQGDETDPDDTARLRDAVDRGDEIELVLKNYRKDGSGFRNRLLIAPILSDEGEVTAYFGVQREETDDGRATAPATTAREDAMPMLRELQHRVKNHLAMVVSMIRLQANRGTGEEAFRTIGHRIEALALLYDDLDAANRPGGSGEVDVCAYLTRVTRAVQGLDGRDDVEILIECESFPLPVTSCARLGLLVSELVTNALKHAFRGRDHGRVWVRLQALSGDALRLVVEDDGVGMPQDSNWPDESPAMAAEGKGGSGGAIVRALTTSLDAGIDVMKSLHGTTVTVDITDPG